MTATAAYTDEVEKYRATAALYRRQAGQVGSALHVAVEGMAVAVDGITALVASLDQGYDSLTRSADLLDQAADNLGLPAVERAPDYIAEAVSSMSPRLRRLFYAARGGREQLLAALVDACAQTGG